jgi:hypothetical protein
MPGSFSLKERMTQEPVVPACNHSYLGGRDQPAWTNSSQDPILKIPNTKSTAGVAEAVEHLPTRVRP